MPPKPNATWRWKREPERAWVDALARLAPRSERVSWLLILWEPGEPWAPVQRWEIREMDPDLAYVDPAILALYDGPDPRTLGHWEGEGAQRRWRGASVISRRQWELYRKYLCVSHRVWVVQGPEGGHPFQLSQAERAFKRAIGLDDTDTPAPGSLPYAEPDQRTWQRVAQYDRLRKWEYGMDWDERRVTKTGAGLWVRRDLTAEYEAYGKAMLDFFTEGVKEAIDSVPRGTLRAWYDAAPKHDGPVHDEDATAAQFVTAAPVSLDRE